MMAFQDVEEMKHLSESEKRNFKQTPLPLFWDTGRRCIDFDGKPRHFPRGTYQQQMSTPMGRLEMDSMELLWDMGQVFNRWSKGAEYYSGNGKSYYARDRKIVEQLRDWYEKQQV